MPLKPMTPDKGVIAVLRCLPANPESGLMNGGTEVGVDDVPMATEGVPADRGEGCVDTLQTQRCCALCHTDKGPWNDCVMVGCQKIVCDDCITPWGPCSPSCDAGPIDR